MLLHEPQDILRGNWVAFMGLPPVLAQRFPVACFIVGVGMQRLSPLKEAVNFSVGENPPMTLAQRSKLPNVCFPAGRPASIHA
jgi:hypothetical protein